MRSETGDCKTTAEIRIDLDGTDLEQIIEEQLMDHAIEIYGQNMDINDINEELEFDGATLQKTVEIEGEYESYHSPATMTEPEEYDVTFDFKEPTTKQIESITERLKTKYPNGICIQIPVEKLIEALSIEINEDEDMVEVIEYEPDWDNMPGGHDYDPS